MPKIDIKSLALCALFCALLAISAQIRFFVPPFGYITMQTFAVLLCGLLLGARRSLFAILAYLVLGLLGLPLFAGGGGISYIVQPTFGFVYGFLPCAWLMGTITRTVNGKMGLLLGSLAGVGALYVCGALHGLAVMRLVLNRDITVWEIVWGWCLIYLPLDAVKALAACTLGAAVKARLHRFMETE